jgi:hypothetical protein
MAVAGLLRRMRCSGACGGRVGAACGWSRGPRVECSCQTAPGGNVGVGGAGLRWLTMPLSPVAHHLLGDLAGIADRPRWRCDNLMPAPARATVQVVRLIWAHAPSTKTRLAFLHYTLPNPIVRQMLQRVRLYGWEIRIDQLCLSVQRRSERDEQHCGRMDCRRQTTSASLTVRGHSSSTDTACALIMIDQ